MAVIIVSITPMLLVSATILYQFHQSYHAKVYAHLEVLVVKIMGGDIEVESTMDAGTTFRVKIPLKGNKGSGKSV